MSLKDKLTKENFLDTVEKEFQKTYPSESEKSLIWNIYKESAEAFFQKPFNSEDAIRHQQISSAFLTYLVKKEYEKEFKNIEDFIKNHKLSHPRSQDFKVKVEGENWVFSFKGQEIFSIHRKNVQTILKEALGIEKPALVLSLTPTEREGIIQAYWGLKISHFKNSLKS